MVITMSNLVGRVFTIIVITKYCVKFSEKNSMTNILDMVNLGIWELQFHIIDKSMLVCRAYISPRPPREAIFYLFGYGFDALKPCQLTRHSLPLVA